ncbi:hypothetical protein B296_00037327 [Ensete ventricosum]|uniref:Uncharacterized protein n=1 Tax=Ensete ventricosum TaxID=4639 RepID=A0A426ZZW3_ENSVE|nr:hypothetical protein B296_00037327 [Ensete ventricosum]
MAPGTIPPNEVPRNDEGSDQRGVVPTALAGMFPIDHPLYPLTDATTDTATSDLPNSTVGGLTLIGAASYSDPTMRSHDLPNSPRASLGKATK